MAGPSRAQPPVPATRPTRSSRDTQPTPARPHANRAAHEGRRQSSCTASLKLGYDVLGLIRQPRPASTVPGAREATRTSVVQSRHRGGACRLLRANKHCADQASRLSGRPTVHLGTGRPT